MPISPAEAARRKKAQVAVPVPVKTYIITDIHFRPNQHGLGGVKTFVRGGKHCLELTEAQAKYWLDAGVIEPEAEEE